MPSDNLSLGFLAPSRSFVCLYIRGTLCVTSPACVCSLSLSLSRLRGALSLSPRVSRSLSLARNASLSLDACLGLSPLDCSRLLSLLSPLFSHRPLTPFIGVASTSIYHKNNKKIQKVFWGLVHNLTSFYYILLKIYLVNMDHSTTFDGHFLSGFMCTL